MNQAERVYLIAGFLVSLRNQLLSSNLLLLIGRPSRSTGLPYEQMCIPCNPNKDGAQFRLLTLVGYFDSWRTRKHEQGK
jgi:hypothetical protein